MKRAYWAGAILVVGFLALGLSTFSRSMTPYVSFAEAKAAPRTVQVMGALEKGTSRYDTNTKTSIPVSYTDVKPANFEDAVSIVAIGRYDNGVFAAEKLLVKCPSKYRSEEIEKQYGAEEAGGGPTK